jgi:hypothetical protein
MKRKHAAKSAPASQPTLRTLAVRVSALEHELMLLGLTGQLRQAMRRIAALEAK